MPQILKSCSKGASFNHNNFRTNKLSAKKVLKKKCPKIFPLNKNTFGLSFFMNIYVCDRCNKEGLQKEGLKKGSKW